MTALTSETIRAEGPMRRIGSYLAMRLPSDVLADCQLRRAHVSLGDARGHCVVRRLNNGEVALLIPFRAGDQLGVAEGGTYQVEIQMLPARHRTKIPADLMADLVQASCDPSCLGESDLRHLVTMVLEADSPVIRKARVEAFVRSCLLRARPTS